MTFQTRCLLLGSQSAIFQTVFLFPVKLFVSLSLSLCLDWLECGSRISCSSLCVEASCSPPVKHIFLFLHVILLRVSFIRIAFRHGVFQKVMHPLYKIKLKAYLYHLLSLYCLSFITSLLVIWTLRFLYDQMKQLLLLSCI